MSLITTRKTRGASKKIAEKNLFSITEDLIHEEVIDFAVDLYGTLTVISENYSRDAVIDLIPHLTNILNRLDASLKVNNDLQESLTEAFKEIEHFKKSLNNEKHLTKETLEASLLMEEDSNKEISTLKNKIKLLQDSQRALLNDIKTKDTTIELLTADCAELTFQLDRMRTDLQPNKKNEDDTFKFPKAFSRPGNRGIQHQLHTSNRYEPLSSNDTISEPPSFFEVTALVHREQTASPSPPRVPRRPNTASSNNKHSLTILADSHGKNLYPHLSGLFKDFNVLSFSKPGAKLRQVVNHNCRLADLSSNGDYILVLAGTNDIGVRQPGSFTIVQGIKALLSKKLPTNIIIADIPYRYDIPNLNNDIFYANLLIKKLIRDYKGPLKLIHLPTNEGVMRTHYTRHGMHFNRIGKRLLGELITKTIRQSKPAITNSLNQISKASSNTMSCLQTQVTSLRDVMKPSSIIVDIPSSDFFNGLQKSPSSLSAASPKLYSSLQSICQDDAESSLCMTLDEFPPLPASPQEPSNRRGPSNIACTSNHTRISPASNLPQKRDIFLDNCIRSTLIPPKILI